MTATALTAETAAGDLLADLRRIEEHLDGIGNLDDLRARLDELTAALRRTRGRIARLAQKAAARTERPAEKTGPAQVAKPTQTRNPDSAAMPLPRPQDAPPLAAFRVSPLDDAAFLEERKTRSYRDYQNTVLCAELGARAFQALEVPDRTAVPTSVRPALERTAPAPTRVAPRRLRVVLAVVVMVCSAVAAGVGWLLDRVRHLFAADRPELEEAPDHPHDCIVHGPDEECCNPLLGIRGQSAPWYVGHDVASVQ